MTDWLTFFGIAAGGGILISLVGWVIDLVPRMPLAAEAAQTLSTTEIALLSGGPGRAIDAKVVELIETGHLIALQGSFALTARGDAQLDEPLGAEAFDPLRADVLSTVRGGGHRGLEVLRRRSGAWALSWAMHAVVRRRMIITPMRRQWNAMVIIGPALLGMFAASMGLVMNDFMGDLEIVGAITIGLWLPVALLIGVLWNMRPGFHGHDPQSRLGRDVLTFLRSRREEHCSSEAERVALDGLAAIHDPALRAAVRGDAAESRWRVSFRRRKYDSTDALLAAAIGMAIPHAFDSWTSDGGDSDGGGGGGAD